MTTNSTPESTVETKANLQPEIGAKEAPSALRPEAGPKKTPAAQRGLPSKKLDLVEEAMEAYGIKLEDIVDLRRYTVQEGHTGRQCVMIRTQAQTTVTFSSGDKVLKLNDEQLNGDNTQRWG